MRGRRNFRVPADDEPPADPVPADDEPRADPAPDVPQRQASRGAGIYDVQWSVEGERVTVSDAVLASQWDITRWRRGPIPR